MAVWRNRRIRRACAPRIPHVLCAMTATAPHGAVYGASATPSPRPGAAGFNGVRRVPAAVNEPIRSYAPGSPERASLKARLDSMAAERIEIPIIIGGKEYRTGELGTSVMPHNHAHVLADYHKASPDHVRMAVESAVEAQKEWSQWAWEDRVAVFLKAADLLAIRYRDTLNAATMLGQ